MTENCWDEWELNIRLKLDETTETWWDDWDLMRQLRLGEMTETWWDGWDLMRWLRLNPLNTSWTRSGQMDPFRVHWNVPPIGELHGKGGPLGHQNLGFSRVPTSQGTPQNWVRSKIRPRTRDMARGPKLKFLVSFFHWELGPKFKITDFLQKELKIGDSFC